MKELNSVNKNRTWDFVEIPHGCQALRSMLIFDMQTDTVGFIVRIKTKMIAKGGTL